MTAGSSGRRQATALMAPESLGATWKNKQSVRRRPEVSDRPAWDRPRPEGRGQDRVEPGRTIPCRPLAISTSFILPPHRLQISTRPPRRPGATGMPMGASRSGQVGLAGASPRPARPGPRTLVTAPIAPAPPSSCSLSQAAVDIHPTIWVWLHSLSLSAITGRSR